MMADQEQQLSLLQQLDQSISVWPFLIKIALRRPGLLSLLEAKIELLPRGLAVSNNLAG